MESSAPGDQPAPVHGDQPAPVDGGPWRFAGPAHGAPPLLRQINSAHVIGVLRGAGPLSLSDLASRTGLSRPTVGQVVDQLHAGGLVAYVEPGHDGMVRSGRPARLVRFRAEAGYVAGIDIGRHQALVTVADLAGTVVAQHRETTSAAASSADLLAALRKAAREALALAGVRRADVASVAAGTPGLVDWPRGAVVLAPGLPGWKIELARELRRSFRCPVQVENDANLAALAERRHGLARDAHTVVTVLWGERVGAGAADRATGCTGARPTRRGRSVSSRWTAARRRSRTRAGRGPFETARRGGRHRRGRAGRGAAARRGTGPARPRRAREGGRAYRRDGFRRRGAGDTAAVETVQTIAARFARGLAPVLLVLDPDLVVIGAGVSRAGFALLQAIEASVGPLTLVRPRLELSRLGDQAVTLGAVELALADAERRLLPGPTLALARTGPGAWAPGPAVLRWRYPAIPVRSAGDSAANGGECDALRTHLCDRRCLTRRSQGGGGAAGRRFRGPDRAHRRRGALPVRAAAAVQGLPPGQRRAAVDLRARRRLVRRQRDRPAPRHLGDGHRPGPAPGRAGQRRDHRLRQAAADDRRGAGPAAGPRGGRERGHVPADGG